MSEPEERMERNHVSEHIRLTQKRKEAILSLISRLRTYEIRKALAWSVSEYEDKKHELRRLSREISKILGQIYSLLNSL